MNKKMIARELTSGMDNIFGIFLGIVIIILSIIVGLKLSDIFPDIPIGLGILIFFVLLICPFWIFVYAWFKIRQKK